MNPVSTLVSQQLTPVQTGMRPVVTLRESTQTGIYLLVDSNSPDSIVYGFIQTHPSPAIKVVGDILLATHMGTRERPIRSSFDWENIKTRLCTVFSCDIARVNPELDRAMNRTVQLKMLEALEQLPSDPEAVRRLAKP